MTRDAQAKDAGTDAMHTKPTPHCVVYFVSADPPLRFRFPIGMECVRCRPVQRGAAHAIEKAPL